MMPLVGRLIMCRNTDFAPIIVLKVLERLKLFVSPYTTYNEFLVLAKGCLTFKTAWGEVVGNQDYSVFRLFVFNVRLEDDLSVVPWIMIDCRYPLSSSPWIRLIVPFGVRNSTLPVFGACEFFFGHHNLVCFG